MNRSSRTLIVVSIVFFTLTYTILVLFGFISKDNRIDLVHLALIGISFFAVVYHATPEAFENIKIFEFGNLKFQFEKVKEQQEKQENVLNEIRALLPLILPSNEIDHLRNLLNRDTANYHGSGTLRSEIRRLRSRNLIETFPGKSASELEDGRTFDLSDFASITQLGKQWLDRIEQLQQVNLDMPSQQ